MKTCTKCSTKKEYSYFWIRRDRKDWHSCWCKDCANKISTDYKKTKNGLIKAIYSNQRSNSRTRNHTPPDYTLIELREWFETQNIFDTLYSDWINSWCNNKLKPSIDRLDDYKPYSTDNIRLVTWKENRDKYYKDAINWINTKQCKSVKQLSINGKIINTFYSIQEAHRRTWIHNIQRCCVWLQPIAWGYVWKFTI